MYNKQNPVACMKKSNHQQVLKTKHICLLTKSNQSHSCTCKIVLDKLMQLENSVFKGILS